MKILTWAAIIFAFAPTLLMAQIERAPSVISCSGSYGENNNYSISWTLGETAITTLQGENMVLTQGFHQPGEIETGIRKNEINWKISAYPNPIPNELNIQFDIRESNNFLLEIQDVTGRILIQEFHENVIPGETVIMNLHDYISGVYFLRIHSSDYKQVKVISLRKL